MTVEILQPHGFCAGVENALRKASRLLDALHASPADGRPKTVYCLHEIVHNELVISKLRARGMVFVDSLRQVPEFSTVMFSAHGVGPTVRAEAENRNLRVVDATCPFVERVHRAARDFAERGLRVVVIGHVGHAEVRGLVGEAKNPVVVDRFPHPALPAMPAGDKSAPLGVVSQTTMNADDVDRIVQGIRRYYQVESTAEVCRATKERQDAVKNFGGDALLVLGSANSSNTLRLCEVARCRTFRAGTLEEVARIDFSGVERLGVTSGASTPEDFFAAAVELLRKRKE